MRGKVCPAPILVHAVRITPAYAGKRVYHRWQTGADRDHPRVCGEKGYTAGRADERLGSPPRMRGKVVRTPPVVVVNGITPAYAGKSLYHGLQPLFYGDHPRVCGEKGRIAARHRVRLGSPPRMRGKAQRVVAHLHQHRITPAYAGKRCWCRCCPIRCRDHPRVCGEKLCRAMSRASTTGSPPRMRGKDHDGRSAAKYRWITPAYAGKRRRAADVAHNEWDHPRVCGEKTHIAWCKCRYTGSPPRMRGKAALRNCGGIVAGITPAYAGKRISGNPTRQQTRDHPRVCGEKYWRPMRAS